MKNKSKINIILFVINILIFIGIIILERSHLCGFNQVILTTCPYYLTNFISFIHRILTYVYYLILIVNVVLSILVIIKEKKKSINYIILFISIISILLNVMIIVYNYNRPLAVDKPIIYIYPEKDINLTIKLKNNDLVTTSYPKYNDKWNVKVSKNGNIYDYKTKRNYYALYWEGKDNTKINESEGFIVEGKNVVKFLENKLEYLGLNEREIEEFIIYWLPELENNKYNYIRFRTQEEINSYMPLEFSEKPDTIIRVVMDFKPLKRKINIKEQKLEQKQRKGFTIVEWGARKLNN